jgi:UDP-MurNAc hydroxylase
MAEQAKRQLCRAKVDSQFARAMRYVEKIDARAVVPSAGPPCFLDEELFGLNMIDGDEISIFPDQTVFLEQLAAAARLGVLNIPGTSITATPSALEVEHPVSVEEVTAIFTDKRSYLRNYQADWQPWLDELKAGWSAPSTDLVGRLAAWWEPLLEMAPTLCSQVAGNVLIRTEGVDIIVDFPRAEVRRHDGDDYDFRFDIARNLIETAVERRAVDWSNSLLLSCRFTAWRRGEFNEYVYNFLKSLSRERMRRTEAEVARKLEPPDAHAVTEPDIVVGGHFVQRRCPHRGADLAAFGEVDGDEFVCTLHGWRFDLHTGRCLTAAGHPLRIRRAIRSDDTADPT